MKVLFICSGNVARSQIAEAYYNYFTHTHDAISAGVDSTTPSRYQHPIPLVITIMKEEGIDLSMKRVKTITEEMVNKTEKVIVLCDKKECPPFILNAENVEYWNITDPFMGSENTMRAVRNTIRQKIQDWLNS